MDSEKSEKSKKKIVLPVEIQKSILKFFLKTSIPRLVRQEQMNKSLSEKKGQD